MPLITLKVNNHSIAKATGGPIVGPEWSVFKIHVKQLPKPGGWDYVNQSGLNGAIGRKLSGKDNPMYGRKRPGNIRNQLPKMWKVAWKKNRCPIMCEGKRFESVGDAERFYGTKKMVRGRLDKPEHPEFYRLKERTRRK